MRTSETTEVTYKKADGTSILTHGYGYDDAGRLQGETTAPAGMSPVSKSFGYDLTSQLTSVTEGGVETESFDFDDNGNRITSSSNGETHQYTPGPNNRYSQVVIDEDGPTGPKLPETWTLNYDDEGNVIAKISETYDRAWTYRYDHRNRLTHVDKREGLDTTLIVEFEYDLFNRRIAKRVERPASPTENYSRVMFYNGEMIWSEETRTASDTMTTRYLTGQFIDQWLARSIDGQTQWFLNDRMGTPYAIADAEGNVLESYEYSPFGGQTTLLSPVYSMLNSSRIGFTGRESDPETGLMYYRARYYDPGMGRFISEDPIGFKGGDISIIRYSMNTAFMQTDSYGLSNFTVTAAIEYLMSKNVLSIQTIAMHQLAVRLVFYIFIMEFASLAMELPPAYKSWLGGGEAWCKEAATLAFSAATLLLNFVSWQAASMAGSPIVATVIWTTHRIQQLHLEYTYFSVLSSCEK